MRPDAPVIPLTRDRVSLARWKGIGLDSLHELNRGEVERLIAKAELLGAGGLTPTERDFLNRMSGG